MTGLIRIRGSRILNDALCCHNWDLAQLAFVNDDRGPMRFDLTDLKLFLHVVEAGSITHGAERMHLAVAAASTRIRNMEAALGTNLLHRERLGVQPTPAGRTLVHHARIMLQQAERMR